MSRVILLWLMFWSGDRALQGATEALAVGALALFLFTLSFREPKDPDE